MSEVFRSYLNSIRREFADKLLDIDLVGDDPYVFFEKWFEEAVGAEALDPYAMSLATVSDQNRPSLLTVYMRDISGKGIVFYTNYNSKKGSDLLKNPFVSSNFFWVELDRQIRFTGKVVKLSDAQSDEYFSHRPRESQIGAWASNQSHELHSREELIEAFKSIETKYKNQTIPRPPFWGGFLIEPDEIEFWQGRPMRLHDRIVFTKGPSGKWLKKRIAP
jgi:pyridoxamine 5'-phosphate oxidase